MNTHRIPIRFISVLLLLVTVIASPDLMRGQSVSAFMSSLTADAFNVAVVDGETNAPVHVEGADLLTKAYGISECELDSAASMAKVNSIIGFLPQEDEYGLWLDSADGYRVNYSGMCPEVSAMARYDDGRLDEMAFFFIFRYGEGERDWANCCQARFCGNLLQELSDMGLELAADGNVVTPVYFDVEGEHDSHPLSVKLREDEGSYVLALHVAGFAD